MHLHRSSALGYASAASAAHSRLYGACAAEAAASEALRLSVGGCPEQCRDFRPYPVPLTTPYARLHEHWTRDGIVSCTRDTTPEETQHVTLSRRILAVYAPPKPCVRCGLRQCGSLLCDPC